MPKLRSIAAIGAVPLMILDHGTGKGQPLTRMFAISLCSCTVIDRSAGVTPECQDPVLGGAGEQSPLLTKEHLHTADCIVDTAI